MNRTMMEANGLTKMFGNRMAVQRVSFSVPQGSVVGYLGPNGAGKSTTLKMFMNLLKPSDGTASLLGHASTNIPVSVWQQIGYVAEDEKLYGWMTVQQMLRYTEAFYPKWDRAYETDLVKRLELPLGARVNTLSKGMRGKLALVLALAYHPELLVLDDPVSGLDPLVRHEFLEQIIDLLHHEGRTVLFSSHILDEVEQIADRIMIIRDGQLMINDALDHLKGSVKRIVMRFDHEPPAVDMVGALRISRYEKEVRVTVPRDVEQAVADLKRFQPQEVTVQDLNLSELFVEVVKGQLGDVRSKKAVQGGVRS